MHLCSAIPLKLSAHHFWPLVHFMQSMCIHCTTAMKKLRRKLWQKEAAAFIQNRNPLCKVARLLNVQVERLRRQVKRIVNLEWKPSSGKREKRRVVMCALASWHAIPPAKIYLRKRAISKSMKVGSIPGIKFMTTTNGKTISVLCGVNISFSTGVTHWRWSWVSCHINWT